MNQEAHSSQIIRFAGGGSSHKFNADLNSSTLFFLIFKEWPLSCVERNKTPQG